MTTTDTTGVQVGDPDPWTGDYDMCDARLETADYLICTAPRGHTGPHVAAGVSDIVGVDPSITDDAHAEAVETIKAHLTEFLVDYDAEEFAWNILNDLCEVGWAAGRAETTTSTRCPGWGGYRVKWDVDRAETTTSTRCPGWGGYRVKWDVDRAETTTATTEDALADLAHLILDRLHFEPSTRDAEMDEVMDVLHRHLLATARTRPTREQIAQVLADTEPDVAPGYYEAQADAVLSLYADQPTEAEAVARALEDAANLLRPDYPDAVRALNRRAARLRGGAR